MKNLTDFNMNQFLDFLNKINKLETIKSDKKNYSYSKMQRQVQSQNNTIVENQVNISFDKKQKPNIN